MNQDLTYRRAREQASLLLAEAGVENEGAESLFLLEAACGMSRTAYLARQMSPMSQEEAKAYAHLVERRCQRIPLQHILGSQSFMGLEFQVDERVLIPRQDTELLVETALACARDFPSPLRILDLCTGSGCIAASMKSFCPQAEVWGVDLSAEALAVARDNGERLKLSITWLLSDLFSAVEEQFHLIVSNPPYIPSAIIPTLMPEVRDHEPRMALDGSADGLLFYRRIIGECTSYLLPGGWLLVEIGYDQGEAVSQLMREQAFVDIEVLQDLAGLDRVVKGRRKKDV